MCLIKVGTFPLILQFSVTMSTNKNCIILPKTSIQISLLASFNLCCHVKNHVSWIVWLVKALFEDTFVYLHPQVPTSYNENILPIIVIHFRHIIKDSVLASSRK
jgi:hypothetical protein